jgi:cytochrome c biogenesis protein CcdA
LELQSDKRASFDGACTFRQNYLVAVAAFVVALLTFFTGFGLGTLLMPAFAWLLHDVPTAVAATAVVHLANNLLKLGLVGRRADRGVVLKFGDDRGAVLLPRRLGADPAWPAGSNLLAIPWATRRMP